MVYMCFFLFFDLIFTSEEGKLRKSEATLYQANKKVEKLEMDRFHLQQKVQDLEQIGTTTSPLPYARVTVYKC